MGSETGRGWVEECRDWAEEDRTHYKDIEKTDFDNIRHQYKEYLSREKKLEDFAPGQKQKFRVKEILRKDGPLE